MEMQLGGMLGLYGGMLMGLLGWWFGRKKARENRGLDEVYQHIWQKARSYSWYMTLAAIYFLFSLVSVGVKMSPAMVLGILLLVQLASWGFSGVVISINMSVSNPVKLNRVKWTLIITTIAITLFTILSITTNNWMILLLSIPPIAVANIVSLIKQKEDESD